LITPRKAIIMGCGSSGGVPSLGVKGPYWGACDPSNPKNFRTRASFYVEYENGVRFVVDTGADFRHHYLKHQLADLSAVLYTHDHADHTHGIDDLRSLFFARNSKIIPIYAGKETLDSLGQRFSYLFSPNFAIYPTVLDPKEIRQGVVEISGIELRAIEQGHGRDQTSFGYRFGQIAYSTDFNHLSDEAIEAYADLDVWVIDCLSYELKKTHNHLDLTLQWIEKVRPKRAILTHMNGSLDYETLKSSLPPHIAPAYDGLTIHL
jgi:phosphoribosyl 1,2-cyclic phosphate phosphodiesterase